MSGDTAGVYDLLREAILSRRTVVCWYKGHRRVCCPHAIGTKRGERRVLVYQYAGGSNTGDVEPGSPKGWRCMRVDELSIEAHWSGDWHTADNHSMPQTCIDEIDVEAI